MQVCKKGETSACNVEDQKANNQMQRERKNEGRRKKERRKRNRRVLNSHLLRDPQPLPHSFLQPLYPQELIHLILVIQRRVPMHSRRSTTSSPLTRQDVNDFSNSRMQQGHGAHDAGFVGCKQSEGGEEVVCSVSGWDLGGEGREGTKFGDGGDAVEGGVTERVGG